VDVPLAVSVPRADTESVLVRVPVPVPVPLNDKTRVRVGVRVAVIDLVRVIVPLGVRVCVALEELVANTPKTRHKKVRNLIILTIEISLTHYKIIPLFGVFCPTTHFNKLFYWLLKLFLVVGYFLKTALGQKTTEIGIK